jgi:hypothetical protein
MLSQEFMNQFNASRQAQQKYTGSKQAYKGFDTSVLGQVGQRFDAERKKIMGADSGASFDSNAIQPERVGDFLVAKTADGRYQVFNVKDPSFGTGSTVGDMYDANSKFLGTQQFDTKKSAAHKAMTAATKLGAAAMIGGGIAGGFGVGPFAQGAPAAGAGTAGAGGVSAAGFGDAGLMYAGADAAAAGSLGMGGVGAAGAGAAGAAGGGGFSLGGLLKSGASSMFGGGGGSGGFDWTNLIEPALGIYGASQAGKASDAQVQATRDAAAMFEPWRKGGEFGINKLLTMLGAEGQKKATAAFQADPGYSFRQSEGEKAMTRAAAASGLRGSGKFLKDYTRFNHDLASQEFGNSVNRLLALSGLGQTATGSAADLRTQGGNAQAAGIVGRANSLTDGFSRGYSMFRDNQLMNRMFG